MPSRIPQLARPAHFLLAVFLLVVPVIVHSQERREADECYGFSFGPFAPPLDRVAAGHRSALPDGSPAEVPTAMPAPTAGAASDRGSAIQLDDRAPRDTVLILYPSWWPVGVSVHWADSSVTGDTLFGVAEAFVADGRARVPTSKVRGWRVPCGSPPRRSASAAPRDRVPSDTAQLQ